MKFFTCVNDSCEMCEKIRWCDYTADWTERSKDKRINDKEYINKRTTKWNEQKKGKNKQTNDMNKWNEHTNNQVKWANVTDRINGQTKRANETNEKSRWIHETERFDEFMYERDK